MQVRHHVSDLRRRLFEQRLRVLEAGADCVERLLRELGTDNVEVDIERR